MDTHSAEEHETPSASLDAESAGAGSETVGAPAGSAEGLQPAVSGGRSASRAIAWTVLILVFGAVLVGGLLVWQHYAGVNSARDLVRQAEATLADAEDDLVKVDAAVRADVTSAIATSSAEATPLAASVREKALAASSLIASALPDLPEEDVAGAQALKDGADARADMMLYAPVILDTDYKAARAIVLADSGVTDIAAAEALITQAAAEFNKHTAAAVKQSNAYTVQAETKLKAARQSFVDAGIAFPGADFGPFVTYLDAKLALVASAKEIDSLWLAGKIAESNAKLAAYNKRDAEIVAMAKALPASVRDPIANAYDTATTQARASYFEARERARQAGELADGDTTGEVTGTTEPTSSGGTTGTAK